MTGIVVITRVNLAMLVQAARLPRARTLAATARMRADHGRHAIGAATEVFQSSSAASDAREARLVIASRIVTICHLLWLHARAAAAFVHLASRYASRILVGRAGRQGDGKSRLGVPLLAAASGSTITSATDGDEADVALDDLSALVASGFGER